tara:strand:+ start:3416 stop:3664 length:249 start_codon:yes stop_codon:yes gene_type:complete
MINILVDKALKKFVKHLAASAATVMVLKVADVAGDAISDYLFPQEPPPFIPSPPPPEETTGVKHEVNININSNNCKCCMEEE